MINIIHTASAPGLRDSLTPVRPRSLRRRREGRLLALGGELTGTADARGAVLSRATGVGYERRRS